MEKYDIHIATQGNQNKEFEKELESLSFTQDKLLTRQVTYFKGVAHSSCPLIGTHMTKKLRTLDDCKKHLEFSKNLLEKYKQIGYVHAEITTLDEKIISKELFEIKTSWPIKKFDAKINQKNKTWDIHIAIPINNCPQKLKKILEFEKSGLYYIDLEKIRNNKKQIFRIYTIQGINNPIEGKKLFYILKNWFFQSNVPYIEMKFETYIGMIKVNNPQIVPPTIDKIEYINK